MRVVKYEISLYTLIALSIVMVVSTCLNVVYGNTASQGSRGTSKRCYFYLSLTHSKLG